MTLKNSKRPTILLVDDTPENLQMLITVLKQAGFQIAVAQSGEEALQRVEHALPDLILLDVIMPDMDGFETCRRLKANKTTKDIPVMFMTALSETVEKVTGFEVGGVDYLTKPVHHDELIARVTTHLTIRSLQRQLQDHNVRLAEQNERFRILSEATFEGILIHDEGRILEVNQRMETMFGYQRADVLGKHVLEFVSPASRNIIEDHLRTKDGQPYEAEGIRRDGSTFPLEIQAKIMPYDGRDVRIVSVRDLSWRKALEEENVGFLSETIPDRYKFDGMIGKSPPMQAVYRAIVKASASTANVMICGESGTGKELVARIIHQRSRRQEGAFVAVNCGAVPESLFEREFFGHRKGAFTGADKTAPGTSIRRIRGPCSSMRSASCTLHYRSNSCECWKRKPSCRSGIRSGETSMCALSLRQTER
jgi:PAS domain S-box-containing protein